MPPASPEEILAKTDYSVLSAKRSAEIGLGGVVVRRQQNEALQERTAEIAGLATFVASVGSWSETGFFRNKAKKYKGTNFIEVEEGVSIAIRESSHHSHNEGDITACLLSKKDEGEEIIAKFIGGSRIEVVGAGRPNHDELGSLQDMLGFIHASPDR